MKVSQYQEMPPREIETIMSSILKTWDQFIKGIKNKEASSEHQDLFNVNLDTLGEIVIRANRSPKNSEYKKTALYAFWLVKLKPFSLSKGHFEPYDPYAAKVNEEFAMYFILSVLKNIAVSKSKNTNLDDLGEGMYREIVYAFQYRDISQEAMMLIVELIDKVVNR